MQVIKKHLIERPVKASVLLPKMEGEIYDRYEMIMYFVRLDEATMETVKPIIPEYKPEPKVAWHETVKHVFSAQMLGKIYSAITP